MVYFFENLNYSAGFQGEIKDAHKFLCGQIVVLPLSSSSGAITIYHHPNSCAGGQSTNVVFPLVTRLR
jgi:hypothetical protein